MNKQIITFKADEQSLQKTGGINFYASNIVSYIEAQFDLGQNWTGYDSVRAVWQNRNNRTCISTVLGMDGSCIVPTEALKCKGDIIVNLVGSIADGDELTDRLTSYPITAVKVDAVAKVCGTETSPVTPSQFEQFCEAVRDAVAQIRDIESTTLNADYTLTFVFSDGTSTTVGPIRGEQGPQGEQGIPGETGVGIESITKTGTSGLVDTYTITFTDGSTTTFEITNGEVSLSMLEGILPTDTASGDIASFPDGTDLFGAKSLTVTLEPIQEGSGTPSPDNVRPISGRTECVTHRTGKNLLDPQTKTEYNANTWRWHYSDGYVLKKDIPYTFSWGNKGSNTFNIYLYIADFVTGTNYNASNNSVTYTPTEDIVVKFQAYYANGIPADAVFQLEIGSTATSYEPYSGTQYTTPLGRTVYGGTLDVVSGELTVDRAMVDLGTLTWANNSTGTNAFEAYSTTSLVKPYTAKLLSNVLVQKSPYVNVAEYTIRMGDDFLAVKLPKTVSTSGAQTKQWLTDNNAVLCYELATPQTYQLTPQEVALLLGSNNVWSDGAVNIVYKADIQRYIQKVVG